MWIVVYMAQDIINVNQIKSMMEKEKILTKIRSLRKSEEDYCYEILVPATEVSEAHGLILEAEL